jgi:hypothetical protein
MLTLCKQNHYWLPTVLVVSLFSFAPPPSKCQPILLQAKLEVPPFNPEKVEEVLDSVPLLGYRPLSQSVLLTLNSESGNSGIPLDLFVASAESNPFLVSSLSHSGKKPATATWRDWYDTACSLPPSAVYTIHTKPPQVIDVGLSFSPEAYGSQQLHPDWLYSTYHKKYETQKSPPDYWARAYGTQQSQPKYDPHPFALRTTFGTYIPQHEKVDANFVSLLPATELFDCSAPQTFYHTSYSPGSEPLVVEMLATKTKYSNLLSTSYEYLDYYTNVAGVHAVTQYAGVRYANSWLSSAPALKTVATFKGGNITFGKPMVYGPREAKLEVPETISRVHDIYAVYFAASFRDIDMEDFDSITIEISPQAESIALDLIPLRYDQEIANTITSGIPGFKTGAGGINVELGSLYQKQVVFKSLKPTVTAFGLQERDFSWSLSGDARHLGSVRFMVILGGPKGSTQLPVKLRAQARYHETWFAQGGIVSTEPIKAELKFR